MIGEPVHFSTGLQKKGDPYDSKIQIYFLRMTTLLSSLIWSRIHSNCHSRKHTHSHSRNHTHCHSRNLLSGIKSNLSSPTWLGIQCLFFSLLFSFSVIPEIFKHESMLLFSLTLEEKKLPGFPQSLWMTERSREWQKESVQNDRGVTVILESKPIVILEIFYQGSRLFYVWREIYLGFRIKCGMT